MAAPARCPDCAEPYVGDFCHRCGQRRQERLTLHAFLHDVRRRVFRLDVAFAHTLWRMLRDPGELVRGYLDGRRLGSLDPIQFFITSVFVQVIVAALTQALAPMIDRLSALNWLSRLGGMVAFKILIIFWLGTLWRLLFRGGRYNLGEIYVFATYALGATNLLWALLPLIDLIVTLPLGDNPALVTGVTLGVESAYVIYAVTSFSRQPLWKCALRVGVVLALGYGLLSVLVGLERTIGIVGPLMP